jgi:hypothetical protein
MNKFYFEYWFRYSGDHKRFDIVTIKSETEERQREEVGKLQVHLLHKKLKNTVYVAKCLSCREKLSQNIPSKHYDKPIVEIAEREYQSEKMAKAERKKT